MSEHEEHTEPAHASYLKIYFVLLGLLLVSFVGPYAEIQVVTLLTAFGVAVVKAYLVTKHFMHIHIEPRYVAYLVSTMVVFMLLLFAGVAPDVMKFEGQNWEKPRVATSLGETAGGTHP